MLFYYEGIAQLVEHLAYIQKVAGSRPAILTTQTIICVIYGDIAQLEEHLLCKQGVEGSNPFISTTILQKWKCKTMTTINVNSNSTPEIEAIFKLLLKDLGQTNVIDVTVNKAPNSEFGVIMEVTFLPGIAPYLHETKLIVNGLTAGYPGTGPNNLLGCLRAAGITEDLVSDGDVFDESMNFMKTHWTREVSSYGDFKSMDII